MNNLPPQRSAASTASLLVALQQQTRAMQVLDKKIFLRRAQELEDGHITSELRKEVKVVDIVRRLKAQSDRALMVRLDKEIHPELPTELEENVLNSHPEVPETANAVELARLQNAVRANIMSRYEDTLTSEEMKEPDDAQYYPFIQGRKKPLYNVFSPNGLYTDKELEFIKETDVLHTKLMTKQREWAKEIILEQRRFDDKEEDPLTEADLKTALKLHRLDKRIRRKCRESLPTYKKPKYEYFSNEVVNDFGPGRALASKFEKRYFDMWTASSSQEILLHSEEPTTESELISEPSTSSSSIGNLLQSYQTSDQIDLQMDRPDLLQTEEPKRRHTDIGLVNPLYPTEVNNFLKNTKIKLLKSWINLETNESTSTPPTLQTSTRLESHNGQTASTSRPVAQINHESDHRYAVNSTRNQ